jgi:hypothetical protein
MPELTLITALIFSLAAIMLLTLYQRRRFHQKELDDAELKSHEILSDAIKKSQDLMSATEVEAIKITADAKDYKTALQSKFDAEIARVVDEYTADFKSYTTLMKSKFDLSQQDYLNYLKYLKEESDKSRAESFDSIRNQVGQMFVKFEEKLTEFLNESQKNSVESIELEIKATRQLIETYKQNQLKLIDENVIAMLERTLSLVLARKLTLKDQIDLVYESLEKAKNEKFLV